MIKLNRPEIGNINTLDYTQALQNVTHSEQTLNVTAPVMSAGESQDKIAELTALDTENKRRLTTAFANQESVNQERQLSANGAVLRLVSNSINSNGASHEERNIHLIRDSRDNSSPNRAPRNQNRANNRRNEINSAASGNLSVGNSVAVAQPTPQALQLVHIGGTADEADRQLVAIELSKLPSHVLQHLENSGTRVIVGRNSIADVRSLYKLYDGTLPGVYNSALNEVVVTTRGHGTTGGAHVPRFGQGHSSYNLVLHEVMHAVDYTLRRGFQVFSTSSPEFIQAREADIATLDQLHLRQSNSTGVKETWAETGTMYYEDPGLFSRRHPNLYRYWQSDPLNFLKSDSQN